MITWHELETLLLEMLKNCELYAKFSKCEFWLNELVILRHISGNDIFVVLKKMEAIVKLGTTQKCHEDLKLFGFSWILQTV